jgi:metallophosphoesterase (TIGR00282 family)
MDDTGENHQSAVLARILFVGDVVGPLGVTTVETLLPKLRAQRGIDFCVANGENAVASGAGIDIATADRLLDAGVDVITTGNHAHDAVGAEALFSSSAPVIRPDNLELQLGASTRVVERDGLKLAVVNVIGAADGFHPRPALGYAEAAVRQVAGAADMILVDVHGSWPAEKLAVAWALDGRVCAVLGTHTHVPTADARLLARGTAYMSDVGMTGARNSVIGFRPDDMIRQSRGQHAGLPAPVTDGDGVLMGALITAAIDGTALAIDHVTAGAAQLGARRRRLAAMS